MKVFVPLLGLTAAALANSTGDAAHTSNMPRVDRAVHRQLQRQGTVNIIVTMRAATDSVVTRVAAREASYSTRGEKIAALVDSLEAHAATSQAEITKLLAQEARVHAADGDEISASDMRSFWISNQVYFREATRGLVEKLTTMSSVASIEEEQVFGLPNPTPAVTNSTRVLRMAVADQQGWNIDKIGAPTVWAAGVTGEGVVIGSIDTGVRATHMALQASFRSDKNWYDALSQSPVPIDEHGQGTHAMGTMVGTGGIGVAPGAKWIACRACSKGFPPVCSQSALLECGQFMLCPTDPNGENKDCSKAPRVINNSWGGDGFTSTTNAWRAAGIIPVFAAGDDGPVCKKVFSPADDPNVIAVGSTTSSDALGVTSSKGPAASGHIKPDISAPGTNIRSAWTGADISYSSYSGTSMAASHVTGAIALLLSAKPDAQYDEIKKWLTTTTVTSTLAPTDLNCGTTPSGGFPNNQYGYGRLDVYAAFRAAGGAPPTPTPTPTPAPTPVAGACDGLSSTLCQATFFCSWNALAQSCVRWWK